MKIINKYLYENEPRPDVFKSLSVTNGTFCNLFDRMVPGAVIPRAFSLIIKGLFENQLSKQKVWCLYYGRCLTNCIIDPSDEQFSEPTPPLQLYKKKLYVIHDAPALTNILNPHFTGFWGLYSRLLLHLVLAGMICLSTFITSSGYTFKQIASTTSSNGRILKSL